MSSLSAFAIVTAAGSGTRLGYDIPKALVTLDGLTLVERAVAGMEQVPQVTGIVVTAPNPHLAAFEALFQDQPHISVVSGGATRQVSVYEGLRAIRPLAERLSASLEPTSPVLIHDAARCLTPPAVIETVLSALGRGYDAVIPGLPVTDTQKMVAAMPSAPVGRASSGRRAVREHFINENQEHFIDEDASTGLLEKVVGQVDRASLRAVQTPQGFHWQTIMHAHQEGLEPLERVRRVEQVERSERAEPGDRSGSAERGGREATDDATLVEWMGKDVYVVPGSQLAMKITTRTDLVLAQALLSLAGDEERD